MTSTWDKTIVDRTEDLTHWVKLFRQFVASNLRVFAYANKHYAGDGPRTIRNFWALWNHRYTEPAQLSMQLGLVADMWTFQFAAGFVVK